MNKLISIYFTAIIFFIASASFAAQITDMDGSVEELLNSADGGKNLIGFGRCVAVLTLAAGLANAKGVSKSEETSQEIILQLVHTYKDAVYSSVGAETSDQRNKIGDIFMNLSNEYDLLRKTKAGIKKVQADQHTCFTFIGSGSK